MAAASIHHDNGIENFYTERPMTKNPDHVAVDLTFIQVVAYVPYGVIVRRWKDDQSKYLIRYASTGAHGCMNQADCDKVDEYLEKNTPFSEELFKL